MDLRLQFFLLVILGTSLQQCSSASARKPGRKDGVQKATPEHELGTSAELQQLLELASKESGTIIITTPSSKRTSSKNGGKRHGEKRKGHRKRTRPTDILKAEPVRKGADETRLLQQFMDNVSPSPKGKPQRRNRNRGSRHLNLHKLLDHHGKSHKKHHHRRRQRTHAGLQE